MKTHTTLTIDIDLLETAKRLGINISGTFNDYLSSYVKKQSQDIAGINIDLERLKKEKVLKKLAELQGELKQTESNIELWEDLRKKQEEKGLQQEKEAIESQKRCKHCGSSYGVSYTGWSKFKIGNICKACYQNSDKEAYLKWSKEEE